MLIFMGVTVWLSSKINRPNKTDSENLIASPFLCFFGVHPKKFNSSTWDTILLFFFGFAFFSNRDIKKTTTTTTTPRSFSSSRTVVSSKSLAEHLHHEVVGLEAALHRLILSRMSRIRSSRSPKTEKKGGCDEMYKISWHIYIFISVYALTITCIKNKYTHTHILIMYTYTYTVPIYIIYTCNLLSKAAAGFQL